MKSNTRRNIFLVVLGYYLLTGNYKGARNFVIGYVLLFVIYICVIVGLTLKSDAEYERNQAYLLEVKAEQNERDRQEAQQFAAEVLPFFVKQFKGRTLHGDFNPFGSIDRYSLKFKILNDSTLTYQTREIDEFTVYGLGEPEKWSQSKKASYALVPTTNDNGEIVKEKLTFQFEGYSGELDLIKSKKKKKYHISTPLTMRDADNNLGVLFE